MFLTNSQTDFRDQFVAGLKNILSDDELGAFILVLANSMQDEELHTALKPDIEQTFQLLTLKFAAGELKCTDDDRDVFNRILATGLDALHVWQAQSAGPWRTVVNPMRSLRPPRASNQVISSVFADFNADGFHFNKPFLKPEYLWQGDHAGRQLRVLYNKFPFVPYHTIIVVEPETQKAQIIDRESHEYIWQLVQDMASSIPGFGAGFNSLGAGASVNHQHFQGFVDTCLLPVESIAMDSYPLSVHIHDSAEQAWHCMQGLLEQDVAFNCLYRQGRCIVLPRKFQGSFDVPSWLQAIGWSDVAGLFMLPTRDVADSLDAEQIDQALSSMRC